MSSAEQPEPANVSQPEGSSNLIERMHSPETLAWVAMVKAKQVEVFSDDDPPPLE